MNIVMSVQIFLACFCSFKIGVALFLIQIVGLNYGVATSAGLSNLTSMDCPGNTAKGFIKLIFESHVTVMSSGFLVLSTPLLFERALLQTW